jgi:hypothetical protein
MNAAADTAESLAHAHEPRAHYRSACGAPGDRAASRAAGRSGRRGGAGQRAGRGVGEALRAALGMLDAECGRFW